MESNKKINKKELSQEEWDYIFDLEKEWQESQPRYSDKELTEIFPEAKGFIQREKKEQEEKRKELLYIIRGKIDLIKCKIKDEFSQWFYHQWIKIRYEDKLSEINKNIARLKRFLAVTKREKSKSRVTEEQKQEALNVPILDIANEALTLQKIGKYYRALCPLHQEKHPSFYIYRETNSFYCYGCKQTGNIIDFVRLLYGYSFKEAVDYLIGEKYE